MVSFVRYQIHIIMLSTELIKVLSVLEAKEEIFPQGCLLFKEGDPVQNIVLLKRGTLRIKADGLTHNSHFQEVSNQKKLWGIREMIMGTGHSCTGMAETELHCIQIPVLVVHRAMRENPSMRILVMQALAAEINHHPYKAVE